MRNDRGHYLSIKDIASIGPKWAFGCPSCTYGIVLAPELTGACGLYLERLVQVIAGDVTFCTCQAGVCYRANLLNRRQILIEEARKDPRMTAYALRSSHPEIEAAQWQVARSVGQRVPTVHMAGEQP